GRWRRGGRRRRRCASLRSLSSGCGLARAVWGGGRGGRLLGADALLAEVVEGGAVVRVVTAESEDVGADRDGDVLDFGVVVGGGGSGHGAQGEGGGGEETGGGGDALHCVPFGHAESWRTRCPRSIT